MTVARIKIGDNYLHEIRPEQRFGSITGKAMSDSRCIFLTSPQPYDFSALSVRDKIGQIIDAVRLGDIEPLDITIEIVKE